MKLSKYVLYYGQDQSPPRQVPLRAGPLSLVYEAGDLRYVRLGDQEILRRVYVAVRDRNWGTVTPVLSNVQLEAGADSFRISYDVENKLDDIDFFWRGTITGGADGAINFSMDGEARSTFHRNRLGFCVLHPLGCAGLRAWVEHVDGVVEKTAFPQYIAPQLVIDGLIKPVHPFDEMQAMAYPVAPGLVAEIRFQGDIFEMEDQRNWTDASFKTYCTPLRLPFPVEVKAGTRIFQSITLALQGNVPAKQVETEEASLTFTIDETTGPPLPRLGLGVASHGQPLSRQELERLKALNLDHLRVDLHLSEPDYQAKLGQAITETAGLGLNLEVALFLSDNAAELDAFARALDRLKPRVWAWLIFHEAEKSTGERWIRLARERLAGYDPQVKLGSGTNVFFTELNRDRPPVELLDLVCYSLNPQVHAFDNLSLVETLAAQAATVDSARQFSGATPLAVSPVTLKMRFNPNATGPEPEPKPGQLPPQVDPRQMSLFGAGWTLGSLKYLAESGTHSLTYYETSGWRGVMETEAGSPLPDKFPSLPGEVFPLYHVLADAGEFAGGRVLPSRSSQPLLVEGLVLHRDNRTRIMLANLSPNPQPVTIEPLPAGVNVRVLDESNVETAKQAPETFRQQPGEFTQTAAGALQLQLPPYALARIDYEDFTGKGAEEL